MLRPARPEDKEAITAFTQGTFTWGDYIDRVFDRWLAEPDSLALVADLEGEVVGFARGALLSRREAWSQGLRVHPAHRRRRIGVALLEQLASWAAGAGAKIMRLSTEETNAPACALFGTMGFRPAGAWLAAEKPLGQSLAGPKGNGDGGPRRLPADPLKPAPPQEADGAILSWAGGPLEQAAHGLFPIRWSWRRLALDDLAAAARRGELWQNGRGWALAELDEESLFVSWVCTDPDAAVAFVRDLVALGRRLEAPTLEVMAPAVDWIRTALERSGCDLHPVTVYARAL